MSWSFHAGQQVSSDAYKIYGSLVSTIYILNRHPSIIQRTHR
jgi:hypothetical protein